MAFLDIFFEVNDSKTSSDECFYQASEILVLIDGQMNARSMFRIDMKFNMKVRMKIFISNSFIINLLYM